MPLRLPFTASIQYAALATMLVMSIFAFGNVSGLQVMWGRRAPDAREVACGPLFWDRSSTARRQRLWGYHGRRRRAIALVALALVSLSGRPDNKPRLALG